MGRDLTHPPNDELKENASDTVGKLKAIEFAYGKPLTITSGYRPKEITFTVDGAKKGDAHEKCCGADLRDRDGSLNSWCMANLKILEKVGLWLEHPSSSKNHCHLQTYPPRSKNRVFIA